MIFKLELSPQNFHYDVLYPLYSGFDMEPEIRILKVIYYSARNGFLARNSFLARYGYSTEIAFWPEMAFNQNLTNQFLFSQK